MKDREMQRWRLACLARRVSEGLTKRLRVPQLTSLFSGGTNWCQSIRLQKSAAKS